MTRLIIILMCILPLLGSCRGPHYKFTQSKWNERDVYYHFRRDIIDDVMENILHKGMNFKEVIDTLGNSGDICNDTVYGLRIIYEVEVNHGWDIDPEDGKDLIISFDKDSLVSRYEVIEWKAGDEPINCVNNTTPMNPYEKNEEYHLGEYLIKPSEKMIYRRIMTGGVNWDGFTYIPDSTIIYDRTSIVIAGRNVLFEERLADIEDLANLHTIEARQGLFTDKKAIYLIDREGYRIQKLIDLSGYQALNDCIYLDAAHEVWVFAPNIQFISLYPVAEYSNIDMSSLKYIAPGYFHDKNGYYRFCFKNANPKGYFVPIAKSNMEPAFTLGKENQSFEIRNSQAYLEGYPVKEHINLKALRFITYKDGEQTGFMTDEKSLFFFDTTGIDLENVDGKEYVTLAGRNMIPITNTSALRIINNQTLIDNDNIYQSNGSSIEIIPFKKLGIPIKIIP